MKDLTKAEEQIMQVLWELGKGFVKDVIDALPEPKPAYNTVSTIVRILEDKGVVGHNTYGKSHEYYPLIDKNEYSKFRMKGLLHGYFGGSFERMVSFFVQEENLSLQEIDMLFNKVKQTNLTDETDGNN